MQISDAVNLTRNVYIHLNPATFKENVGADSYPIWFGCGHNIITFNQRIKPDYQKRFWSWISRLGIESIEQVYKVYAILTLIHDKIHLLPSELRGFYSISNNVAVFISGLGDSLIEILVKWAESILTPEEIDMAIQRNLVNFSDINPGHNNKSVYRPPITKMVPNQKIVNVSTKIPNNNGSGVSSTIKGVRSLEQLRRDFGEI